MQTAPASWSLATTAPILTAEGAAIEKKDFEQLRKASTARENAIRQLEKHQVDYRLELTEERRKQILPLRAAVKQGQKRTCESGYIGVYKGRKDRWQAQVDHRAIGGFPTAFEAGKAVTTRMIELAQGLMPEPTSDKWRRNAANGNEFVRTKKMKPAPQQTSPSSFFNDEPSTSYTSNAREGWEASLHHTTTSVPFGETMHHSLDSRQVRMMELHMIPHPTFHQVRCGGKRGRVSHPSFDEESLRSKLTPSAHHVF
ncbi:MAG: hypothetical protein SGPRY_000772 [Prymnesium sp.]